MCVCVCVCVWGREFEDTDCESRPFHLEQNGVAYQHIGRGGNTGMHQVMLYECGWIIRCYSLKDSEMEDITEWED